MIFFGIVFVALMLVPVLTIGLAVAGLAFRGAVGPPRTTARVVCPVAKVSCTVELVHRPDPAPGPGIGPAIDVARCSLFTIPSQVTCAKACLPATPTPPATPASP